MNFTEVAERSSIVARLTGGLGNQMFQYACARTIADAEDKKLVLDARRLDLPGMRKYELSNFCVRYDELVRSVPVSPKKSWLGRRIQSRNAARHEPPPLLEAHDYRESDPTSQTTDVNGAIRVIGFWQSPNYFFQNPGIQSDLSLTESRLAEYSNSLPSSRYAIIHVRRGDYLHKKNRKTHQILGIEYYQDAIALIEQKQPGVPIYAVSDDPEWVSEQNLPLTVLSGESPLQDFYWISKASSIVCANSTFSWWAAWLSSAAVIALPSSWEPLASDSARLDSRWHIIDNVF
ncbi:alpha-1,2-fucosyltransferase [Rhodococcus opacus]|uniref:alpha-1,2-fucosyltransferase n=1 Tax=Rhodococcus opacus TaxID=37919 RepID=UPI000AE90764|nr:alpha-1,2-fucosyltransferase [Rhodococcus opacus]MDX5962964.1 alpha-1,2-fucosyltransferase [Rhodococcus opacus]NKY69823.1 alpha-1,2-fucosyltransferase [Rhodococcus opacus]CAG7599924.1 O-antigen biosynthesis glycosyltransferase WbnK [Rhodococcus opacus]